MNLETRKPNTTLAAAACILGAMFALSGCFVLSVHPLYDEGDTVMDSGLVGVWAPEGDEDTWQFSADGEGGYRLVTREENTLHPESEREGLFSAHIVELGGQRYLDLLPEEPGSGNDFYLSHIVPGHSLWRMSREGHVLELRFLSPDALQDLIEASSMTLDHLERDGVMVLTAPTSQLQDLLAEHGDALFPESETLQRVR